MEALTNLEMFERIAVSLVAGIVIGLEREWNDKPAGMRTYALVCEGSALFMIIALLLAQEFHTQTGGSDPSRIASTVVQGVGFIAGGVIFTHGRRVNGLTTAAGLWVTAAVGLIIGAGYYEVALMGIGTLIFVLVPLRWVERKMRSAERLGGFGRNNGHTPPTDATNP